MDQTPSDKARWPRLTLTLPPELASDLAGSAQANLRDQKREALRLLRDGIERERQKAHGR